MPSMAISARSRSEAETTAEGWPASTVLMYRMYGMPISPKAPTFGAGAKIGDAAIAEKDN